MGTHRQASSLHLPAKLRKLLGKDKSGVDEAPPTQADLAKLRHKEINRKFDVQKEYWRSGVRVKIPKDEEAPVV